MGIKNGLIIIININDWEALQAGTYQFIGGESDVSYPITS